MIRFDCEPAFILNRTLYRENSYLLDIYFVNLGYIRGVARIPQQKTYRNTENYASFRELSLSGQQKTGLATIWNSEIIGLYPLEGREILNVTYANEIMLGFAAKITDFANLYAQYKTTLETPDAPHLRLLEWFFIDRLGIFPEREKQSEKYQLFPSTSGMRFIASQTGYDENIIDALEHGLVLSAHPQIKHLLQSILNFYSPSKNNTRNISTALLQLLK